MKKTPTIYKVHNQYLLDRTKLFDIVKKELDEFFIINLQQDIEKNGNYPVSKTVYTEVQNEFSIGSVTLPLHVLIVDEAHKDIQTNAQVLIRLNLTIREQIEGMNYD